MQNLHHRQSTALLACVAAGALLVSAVYNRWPGENPAPHATSAITNPAAAIGDSMLHSYSRDSRKPAVSATPERAFAPSLRGTQRDGRLRADDDGNLIIERGIRDLFDYYLTTLGEHDLPSIHARLLTLFQRELPAPAAQQATQLLDAYLQYREQSGALQDEYPTLNEENASQVIADYFARRDELRRQLFAADAADAFFDADARHEQTALQTLQQLSDPQAQAAPDADNAAAHDSYTQYRAAKSARQDALAQDALRNELFGRIAADRLANLDQQRSDWKTRLQRYRDQKQQLLTAATQAGIDPASQQEQLQQLQQSQFNAREIMRLRALDRIQQQGLLPP